MTWSFAPPAYPAGSGLPATAICSAGLSPSGMRPRSRNWSRRHGSMVLGVARRETRRHARCRRCLSGDLSRACPQSRRGSSRRCRRGMALWRRSKGSRAESTTKAVGEPGARATGVASGNHASGRSRSRLARSANLPPHCPSCCESSTRNSAGCRMRIGGSLVLCYLEGRTQDEAARQLGLSLGAFRGRLERGRARLRDRLTRRGVGLAVLAAAAGARPASVATAAQLAITNTAAAVAAGETLTIPAAVAALAEGAMRTMFVTKLQCVAGVVAVCGMLTVGGVWATGQGPGTRDAGAGAAGRGREGKSATAGPDKCHSQPTPEKFQQPQADFAGSL